MSSQRRMYAGAAPRLLLACLAMVGCVEATPVAVERGTVISARLVEQSGDNTGTGAIAGVVIGTAIGAGFGGGAAGQVVAATAGAVVGAALGSAAEGASQTLDGVEYTIRLLDGRVVTVTEHKSAADPVVSAGAAVVVETRGRKQHVVAVAAGGLPTAD